jgi:hypothetical protein
MLRCGSQGCRNVTRYLPLSRYADRYGDLHLPAFVARLRCEVCRKRPVHVEMRRAEMDGGRLVPGRMGLALPIAWTRWEGP